MQPAQAIGSWVCPKSSPLSPAPCLLDSFQKDNVFLTLEITECAENGSWSLSRLKAKQVQSKFFIFLVSGPQWAQPSVLGLGPGSAPLILKPGTFSLRPSPGRLFGDEPIHNPNPHSTSPKPLAPQWTSCWLSPSSPSPQQQHCSLYPHSPLLILLLGQFSAYNSFQTRLYKIIMYMK